ncbi:hypothetical protein Tco_0857762 [Tanacetum coccineum]|uniref:Uncharacterized protein n=1 Tax=Tanacetum coccineum TaxID=301880 RepID=A0ABQ5B7I4_9ASTR
MVVAFADREEISAFMVLCQSSDPWLPWRLLSKKYFDSTSLLHVPFISSNVGPANNSGVRVSILSRFIINAEKSRGVSISSSNDSRGPSSQARLLNQVNIANDPDLWIDLLLSIFSMRIFFSSNSDRLAAIARDVLDSVVERVITATFEFVRVTVFYVLAKSWETCA